MGWIDGVKRVLNARGISVKQKRMFVHKKNSCDYMNGNYFNRSYR